MTYRKRKAFSMVELVVVIMIIAILAVALFAGGGATINKSRVARTSSDLHNFSVAIESALNEHPSCLNVDSNNLSSGNMSNIIRAVNKNLPTDYQIEDISAPLNSSPSESGSGIRIEADTPSTGSYLVYESKKTDAWDNPYYMLFDCSNISKDSDFHVVVASVGANGLSYIGKQGWDEDDILLYVRDRDSEVTARTYSRVGVGESYFQAIGGARVLDERDSVASSVVTDRYGAACLKQNCEIGTQYIAYSNTPLTWFKISDHSGGWNTIQYYGPKKNVFEFTMVENSHISAATKQYIFAAKSGMTALTAEEMEKASIIVIPKPVG